MTKAGDRQTFRNEDLVLAVKEGVDLKKWDESKYEAFLDELCGVREYQKTAIRTTLRYILGGGYVDLRELAKENFENNEEIQQRYGSWEGLERSLQLPGKQSCSIDLATGTGKSYVLYGLAAILLAEGRVDRVLVLCPSNTIEAGLLEKFRELASRAELRELLPSEALFKTPEVIDATSTISEGSICVENFHAVFEHVGSSIRDSLKGNGAKTAVLCDEYHHVVNQVGAQAKKWKQFLLDEQFGFQIVIGLSGTCYVKNDYFADVVARFSLRQAMEQNFIKQVDYVTDMPDQKEEELWQLFRSRHEESKKKLKKRGIRPLSLVVTRDIASCDQIAATLRDFLVASEKLTPEIAFARVLPVTSDKKHQANIVKLQAVDTPESPVEWIVSVSMLTEGWDVKNVFQIVPHEERAFESKLLVSQVLGRGLRRPIGWVGEPPVVTVFNHPSWSLRIRHIVVEVLEIERRLSSIVLPESALNFTLHDLDYTRQEDTTEYTKKGKYDFLTGGFVDLPTQVIDEDINVQLERAIVKEKTVFRTTVTHKTYSADEVAEAMFRRLKSIDEESSDAEDPDDRTDYAKQFPFAKCRDVVLLSLEKAKIEGDRVTDENRQKFLQALGTLRRKRARRVVYKLQPMALVERSTAERQAESVSAGEIRRGDNTVFFSPISRSSIAAEQIELFDEVIDPDGGFSAGAVKVSSQADIKSPQNIVITDAMPERKFVRLLTDHENASEVDSWLKNAAQRFYFIEYAWKKGEHQKRGEFSPDFFIKQGDVISVVEIKSDEEVSDPSPENHKKFEFASNHFVRLNDWLKIRGDSQRYHFNFLSPQDFGKYFQRLREHKLVGFRSSLDIALSGA